MHKPSFYVWLYLQSMGQIRLIAVETIDGTSEFLSPIYSISQTKVIKEVLSCTLFPFIDIVFKVAFIFH